MTESSDFEKWRSGEEVSNVEPAWVFGDRSEVANRFAATATDTAATGQLCRQLLDNDRLRNLAEVFGIEQAEITARVTGLAHVIDWRQTWRSEAWDAIARHRADGRDSELFRECRERLLAAIDQFDTAWPSATVSVTADVAVTSVPAAESSQDALIEHAFEVVADERGLTRGFAVAHDLVRRLCGYAPSHRKSATTAMLFCETDRYQAEHGRVLWLTVDLYHGDGVGFAPDPIPLGLTSITGSAGQTASFLAAMDKAWRLSGVEKLGYRGCWRLESHCPVAGVEAELREAGHDRIVALPWIAGPSGESATLTAIWAASGVIPYGQPDHHLGSGDQPTHPDGFPQLKLLPPFVITACLDDSQEVPQPTDLPLVDVDAVDKKLEAVRQFGMDDGPERSLFDTVIVSAADKNVDSEVQTSILQAQAEADAAAKSYEGIRLDFKTTIGDALNFMLETNRWLKEWHAQSTQVWERAWDGDTGKLEVMRQNQTTTNETDSESE